MYSERISETFIGTFLVVECVECGSTGVATLHQGNNYQEQRAVAQGRIEHDRTCSLREAVCVSFTRSYLKREKAKS